MYISSNYPILDDIVSCKYCILLDMIRQIMSEHPKVNYWVEMCHASFSRVNHAQSLPRMIHTQIPEIFTFEVQYLFSPARPAQLVIKLLFLYHFSSHTLYYLIICASRRRYSVNIPPSNNEAQSCSANFLTSLASIALLPSSTPNHESRASRKDTFLQSKNCLFSISNLGRRLTGTLQVSTLPPFEMSRRTPVPGTPRVISPSPTPSEVKSELSEDGYL